ncbi:MAG TPA: universal stress protein [Candidatus Acidoferrum sp.]|nr:universal stress protein [Candidatus Acidoferrum sp.]
MKRILVPLDLTTEPDAVTRVVADAARGAGATVRLLYVAPVPDAVVDVNGRIVAYADQEGARLEAEALDYLRSVEIAFDDAPVESIVRFGDPAEEILREADEFGADLIALTTPRGTGFKRCLPGGTASRVWRHANAAVMLLQPPALIAV